MAVAGTALLVVIVISLGPSDAIWRKASGSTLAQVMACCLTAPMFTSSVRSNDIHLRACSQEIPQPSITEFIRKIKYLKCQSDFPGANELSQVTVTRVVTLPMVLLWHSLFSQIDEDTSIVLQWLALQASCQIRKHFRWVMWHYEL